MKIKIILLLFLSSLNVMGQGTITHKKSSTVSESKKVSHVATKKVVYKEKECSTCGKSLSSCDYKGKHPVYHNVNFVCDIKNAKLFIDGYVYTFNGDISVEEGHHSIKVEAEWYDCYTNNIEVTSDQTLRIDLKPTCKTKSGILIETTQAVDLGLPSGTKWAGYNIGASSPEEIGGLYAWGETKTKSEYTWQNYFDVDQSKGYKDTWPQGYITYKKKGKMSIIGTKDDVATKSWGNPWQIPSYVQYIELSKCCDVKEDIYMGTIGYVIIGQNKKAIFLPDVNYYWLGDLSDGKGWGKQAKNGKAKVMNLKYIKYSSWLNEDDRYRCHPIRAVRQ